jgi:hypothetical protein
MNGTRHMLAFFYWLFRMFAVQTYSAQDKLNLSQASISPEVKVDRGRHASLGPRTIPYPTYASQESRQAYMALVDPALNAGQPTDPKEYGT